MRSRLKKVFKMLDNWRRCVRERRKTERNEGGEGKKNIKKDLFVFFPLSVSCSFFWIFKKFSSFLAAQNCVSCRFHGFGHFAQVAKYAECSIVTIKYHGGSVFCAADGMVKSVVDNLKATEYIFHWEFREKMKVCELQMTTRTDRSFILFFFAKWSLLNSCRFLAISATRPYYCRLAVIF